ncbi:Uma2 family endonuclease, partial [Prochlorothrix hollandica]
LTLDQYQAMVRSQILTEADALEFLDGFLIPKMIKNPPHRLSTGLLQDVLLAWLPPGFHLNVQEPMTLVTSEPEPDLAVVRGQRRDYRDRHPGGAEVLLVVEVADATLARDRGLKQRLYSAAAIPHYWILNLVDRQLECYSNPQSQAAGSSYGDYALVGEGEAIIFPWEPEGQGGEATDRTRPVVGDLL